MASNAGKRKPYQIQQPPQASDIDAMFEQLYRRVKELEDRIVDLEAGDTHNLLDGDVHPDTTAGTVVDGDLVVGQASKWARKAKGADGQHLGMVAGAPEWTNDGSGLQDIPAGELTGTVPTAAVVHDVLSAHHQDSTPASAVLGDIIVAQASGAIDALKYWLAGEPFNYLPSAIDNGAQKCWLAGAPASGLVATVTPLWTRLPRGTAGQQLVSTAVGVEWGSAGATSGAEGDPVAAHAQQAGDVAVAHNATAIISFAATSYDSGGFFAAAQPTRLTVPNGQSGLYLITGQATVDNPVGNGSIAVRILKNGSKVAESELAGINTSLRASGGKQVGIVLDLLAGDYLEMEVAVEDFTLGSVTILGGATSTFLQITKCLQSETIGELLPDPVRGALVKGNAGATAYERLAIGAADTVLLSDGVDPSWSARPTLRDIAEAISGVWNFANGLRERGRTDLLGDWIDVAFDAGNFDGNGTQTWTLVSGDQLSFAYTLVGKTMLVAGYFNTSSVGGVANTDLRVVIPDGYVSDALIIGIARVNDAGAGFAAGTVYVTSGGTTINFQKIDGSNWTGSTDTTAIQFSLAFPIQ